MRIYIFREQAPAYKTGILITPRISGAIYFPFFLTSIFNSGYAHFFGGLCVNLFEISQNSLQIFGEWCFKNSLFLFPW